VSIATRRCTALLQLVSSDVYLRMGLDNCLTPCCVRLFSVRPEEIVVLVGRGLLFCLGRCPGASSGALRLCNGRRGRHGVQCRWMCSERQLRLNSNCELLWTRCSGRRDDGEAPSMWNVLNRHTWPKFQPHRAVYLDPSSSLPAPQSSCCGQATVPGTPVVQTFRLSDFKITGGAEGK